MALGEPGIVHVVAVRVNSPALRLWRIGRLWQSRGIDFLESVP
jgi:hypothetical protein